MKTVTKFDDGSGAAGDPTHVADGLSGYVRRQLEDMSRYRDMVVYVDRLALCLRAREGRYSAGELKAINEFGGSDVYARITTNKIRGAAAMLRGIFVQSERPWEMRPSPVPTLPEDITASVADLVKSEAMAMEQAGQPVSDAALTHRTETLTTNALALARKKAAAEAVEGARYVDDILVEGGFYEALNEFLLDFATLPMAVLCGPTAVMVSKLNYENGKPVKTRVPVLQFRRVDPYDIMWTPGATTLAEADVIERRRMTRSSLQTLIGLDGYDEQAVRSVLREYGEPGYSEHEFFDQVRDDIQNQESRLFQTGTIDMLCYTGAVPGKHLLDIGLTEAAGSPIDPDLDYLTQIWQVNRYVLKVQIDPDPRERHSYFAASFEPVPGSVIGTALAELMGDVQSGYNAAFRALHNNLGLASGPQVAVNQERIAPGTDASELHPWKIWYFTSDPAANAGEKPIEFFQPASNAQELMSVLTFLQTLGDEVSAIPRYMTGGEKVGGAGRTASGLSMLMSNATRTMTSVAGVIDVNVIGPIIQKTYDLIMLTTGNSVLKGDTSIVARGATHAEKKETDRMRMLEFLQYTNNPTDLQITGIKGRSNVLREVSDTFMDGETVVPPEHEIEARERAQQQQQEAAQQAQLVAQQAGAAQQQAGAAQQQQAAQAGASQQAMPANGKAAPQAMAAETDNMHRVRN